MKQGRIGKRIVAGALAMGLALNLSGGAAAANALEQGWFNEPSPWAAAEVERAAQENLLQVLVYGSDLQGDITRQEFAVLAVQLAKGLGLNMNGLSDRDHPFTDAGGNNYIDKVWALGIMQGVSDTEFAPLRTITRMEICTLLSRVMKVCGIDELPQTVPGVAERLDSGAEGVVPDWAREGVAEIVGAGLMQGGSDGSLALTAQTSREQAMILGLRCLDMGREILEVKQEQQEQEEQESYLAMFTPAEQAQIAKLNELRATFGNPGEPYAQAPSVSAPYSPGKLNDAFLQDGLNAINYIRAIAGLSPVTMSDEKNESAQTGALLLATSEFSHYPSQPADMPDDLYQQGYAATSTSNIGMGHGSLSEFTLDCADDSDSSNYTSLGHRRWLLDPTLTTVGLGYAQRCSTTKVIDENYVRWNGPDYVTWPTEGVFPMELFHEELSWSCSVDPQTYINSGNALTVTVTDQDGNTWSRQTAYGAIPTDFAILSMSNYGGAPAVIFRPAGLEYRVGGTYTVEISGLTRTDGGTGTITYTVKLF